MRIARSLERNCCTNVEGLLAEAGGGGPQRVAVGTSLRMTSVPSEGVVIVVDGAGADAELEVGFWTTSHVTHVGGRTSQQVIMAPEMRRQVVQWSRAVIGKVVGVDVVGEVRAGTAPGRAGRSDAPGM